MKKHVLLLLAIMFGITGCHKSSETTKPKEESNTERYVLSRTLSKLKLIVYTMGIVFLSHMMLTVNHIQKNFISGIDAPELIHPIYKEMPLEKKLKKIKKVIKENGNVI